MTAGDFVMVIGTDSLPEEFLGRYGLIIKADSDSPKVCIEFKGSVKTVSSMVHTAYRSDLMKAGVSLI